MSTVAILASLAGAFSVIANGYLVYLGSKRASDRTRETQKEANAMTGFQALTQEQRVDLTGARDRADRAEAKADRAEAKADEAENGLGRMMVRVEALTQAYRDLYAWAQEPCPHDRPPPQPPLRLAIDL